tara:strand:+ start:56895 stop:57332 length:438 start_codon:yes stop_codon:yes gene_type:complete
MFYNYKKHEDEIHNEQAKNENIVKENIDKPKYIESTIKQAVSKLKKIKYTQFKEDLKLSINLIKDWFNGSYKKVPKKTIISLIAALVYFINPFDLIPDFIINFGFLDDISVLYFVFQKYYKDLEDYRKFLNNQKQMDWIDEIDKR